MSDFKHIYSISGGQDSTAMTVRALELGHQVDYIIFCDTGNEFPQMYKYLADLNEWLLKKYNIGITRLSSKDNLETLCSPFKRGEHKGTIRGLPYSSSMSFCTRELKKNVAKRFAKEVFKNECYGVFMNIGYVSHERNRMHEANEVYIVNEYPLIDCTWNEDHVTNFLKQMGIYNHLYDYFTRTGCMFCPKQNLASWKALYVNFPQQYKIAQSWEQKAKEQNAHIKTFRSDYSLTDLAFRFERELKLEKKQIKFSLDWNEENVSCFCK